MENFSQLLIRKREDLNLNKKQMAEKLNWTPMYYARYEKGQLLPKGKNIDRFARLLNIKTSALKEIIDNDSHSI